MVDFLTQNPVIAILFIVIVIAAAVFLAVKAIQKVGLGKIQKYVYQKIDEAEHEFKYGDNEQKFEYVIQLARSAIPSPFNLFITESLLRKTVQLWFDLIKDIMYDGKLNGVREENTEEKEN